MTKAELKIIYNLMSFNSITIRTNDKIEVRVARQLLTEGIINVILIRDGIVELRARKIYGFEGLTIKEFDQLIK